MIFILHIEKERLGQLLKEIEELVYHIKMLSMIKVVQTETNVTK